MNQWLQFLLTIICAALTSSGLWAILQKRFEKNDVKTQLMMAIAHDRIVSLGMCYIRRKRITREEYNNLTTLYKPYFKLDENGDASRIMLEVQKLPFGEAPIKKRRIKTYETVQQNV